MQISKPEGWPYENPPDIDLGLDHYLVWVTKGNGSNERVGAIIYNRTTTTESGWCGGSVSWAPTAYEQLYQTPHPRWLIEGQIDDHLTLVPSVLCTVCGDHGW